MLAYRFTLAHAGAPAGCGGVREIEVRVVLTDRFVANAKAPKGRAEFFDATVSGLSLRVNAGNKSWAFTFTSPKDGKRSRLTIGTYPATPLAEARTRALEARIIVERGEDPRLVLGEQAASAMTVTGLLESYLAKHALANLRSGHEVERRLRKNVQPVIGSVKLSDLHRRDINRVIDAITKRGRPIEANRVFEDLRAMLRWAVARGDLDRNPMEGMNKPSAPRTRERVLSDAEIRTLWTGLSDALPRSKAAQRIIRLCLLTAQRVGEIAGMRRSELDLKARIWSLPGSRTKNGHPHLVPLPNAAIRVIEEALADVDEGDFVFPAMRGSLSGAAVARTILRAHAVDDNGEGVKKKADPDRPPGRFGIAPWSAHDLRRTALTGMARLGVAPIVLGHVANHRTTTKAGVTLGVYVQHSYEKEVRQALELWANRLATIVAGGGAEVVTMRGRS